jgi:hypothetical protein
MAAILSTSIARIDSPKSKIPHDDGGDHDSSSLGLDIL